MLPLFILLAEGRCDHELYTMGRLMRFIFHLKLCKSTPLAKYMKLERIPGGHCFRKEGLDLMICAHPMSLDTIKIIGKGEKSDMEVL